MRRRPCGSKCWTSAKRACPPYREAILSMETYCRGAAEALAATFGDLDIRIIGEPALPERRGPSRSSPPVIGKDGRGDILVHHRRRTDMACLRKGLRSRRLHPARRGCGRAPAARMHRRRPNLRFHRRGGARDQPLPELEIGELLLVPSMGPTPPPARTGFNGLDIAHDRHDRLTATCWLAAIPLAPRSGERRLTST